MENPNMVFGIINISCGLLFILMSIPLVVKKIPMNKLYGFRISKSFTSDENWYKINSYGGKQLIYWSVLLVVIGGSYFLFPSYKEHQSEIVSVLRGIGPMVVVAVIVVVKTIFYSKTLP